MIQKIQLHSSNEFSFGLVPLSEKLRACMLSGTRRNPPEMGWVKAAVICKIKLSSCEFKIYLKFTFSSTTQSILLYLSTALIFDSLITLGHHWEQGYWHAMQRYIELNLFKGISLWTLPLGLSPSENNGRWQLL